MNKRRLFLKNSLILALASTAFNVQANGRRKKIIPVTPASKRSQVVNASRAAKGHMPKHVAKSPAFAKASVKSATHRRLFNTVALGATPKGNMPRGDSRRQLEKALQAKHAKQGLSKSKTDRLVKQSLASLNKQVNHLNKYRSTKKSHSIIGSPKMTDQLFAQAMKDSRNRKELARLRQLAKKNPMTTVPIRFDAGKKTIGSVYIAKPSDKRTGKHHPASKGVFNVRMTPDGKIIAHTVKLQPHLGAL